MVAVAFRRRFRRSLVVARAGLLAWGLASTALGQGTGDKAAADVLFDTARKAMDAGNYEVACPKFVESQKLDPGVGTLMNLARCYDLSGKSSSAYSTYREAAAMARAQGQDDREAFARGEVTRLEPKLTRLIVKVSDELRALPGLSVKRSDSPVPESMWGVAVPVDPGAVVIEVSAPGYLSKELTTEVRGEGKTVELAAPMLEPDPGGAIAVAPAAAAEEPAAAAEEPRASAVEPPAEQKGRSLVGPLVLGGAGVALVAVGTVFAILGQGQNDTASKICVGVAVCPAQQINDWWDARDAASLDYTIAYVGWGVGGAAILGGTVWLLAGGKSTKEAALQATPLLGARTWGLSLGGRF